MTLDGAACLTGDRNDFRNGKFFKVIQREKCVLFGWFGFYGPVLVPNNFLVCARGFEIEIAAMFSISADPSSPQGAVNGMRLRSRYRSAMEYATHPADRQARPRPGRRWGCVCHP